jgi:hypothetical protein
LPFRLPDLDRPRARGKVLDAAGKPAPNLFVNVGGLQTGDRRYMGKSNAAGEFDLVVPASNGYYESQCTVDAFQNPDDTVPLTSSPAFTPRPGRRTHLHPLPSRRAQSAAP